MRPVRYSLSDASGAVKIGSMVPLDIYLKPFQVSLQVVVNGSATYTVEYTEDNIWAVGYNPDAVTSRWVPMANMDDEATSGNDTLVSPVVAVRARQLTGNGSIDFTVLQAGMIG